MSSLPSPEPAPERSPLPVDWLDLVTASTVGDGVSARPEASEDALAALGRARGHLRALAALERLEAPAALDGMVVGSLNAGARQDRAVDFTRSLPALEAPAVLDKAVAAVLADGPTAPSVLDRLVEERLEDPEKAMSRSMADRLESQRAPVELENRVRAELGADTMRQLDAAGTRGRVLAAVGAAVMAVLLVFTANSLLDSSSGGEMSASEPGRGRVSLEVVHVTADELSPSDRALLQVMGGPL